MALSQTKGPISIHAFNSHGKQYLTIIVNYNEEKVNKVLQDYRPAFMQLQGAVGDISVSQHLP